MKTRAIALLLSAALACGGRSSSKKSGGEPAQPGATGEADQDKPADKPAPPAQNPMAALGAFGSLLSSRADEPGPYDEPRESKGFRKSADHFAVIELDGDLVELEGFSWFGGKDIELRAATDRLIDLAGQEKITGLLLRVGDLSLDVAHAEELRAALVAFKSAGGRQRKLFCHTESAANAVYYVLTACDAIGLAPTGDVMVTGAAAMPIHLKGLLDKVGVRADFVHVGAFKGAAEPLTRDQPSPEMVETLQAIIDSHYEALVSGLVEGRKLDADKARALIDNAVFQSEGAVKAGLVDQVATFEKFRDGVLAGAEWKVLKISDEGEPSLSKLMEWIGITPRVRPRSPHVALVYAVGDVVDGKGEGLLGAREQIASRPLAAAFRTLAGDDAVKAIVLRIDSGGGSALASELIWNAIAEAKAKKPVVVSMGGVAASGGYYIACGANKIFAEPDTLTGSIGVVGGKLAIGGALDKVGIRTFPMGRGKRALMWSSVSLWSADERQTVQQLMEEVYKVFVGRVAEGRGKSYDEIHAIAQGRVWTGAEARKRGLVDELGGLDDALAEARKLGGVPPDAKLEVYPPEPTLLDIVGSFGNAHLPFGLDAAVAEIARTVGPAHARAVEHTLDQLLLLRRSPVLAAFVFPVVLE